MIESLSIERFKSIRAVTLDCRKVNVFVGPPDTGKTNILEGLALLSALGWQLSLDDLLRLRPELGYDPLFYRQFFDTPIRLSARLVAPLAGYQDRELAAHVSIVGGDRRQLRVHIPAIQSETELAFGTAASISRLDWVRWYSYVSSRHWEYRTNGPHGTTLVTPPYGVNLLYIARHNQKVYDFLKNLIAGLNWKLRFDQTQKTFRLSEVREDEILDYNLDLLSDSLKRLFFYGAILLTSENATIVLDEPDVFAFPPYPKTLGEMIGSDPSNQFFLTTHNPYFLAGLLGKTPADQLALFVCFRDRDGATAVKSLTSADIARVIEQGANVFFNLDDFIDQ